MSSVITEVYDIFAGKVACKNSLLVAMLLQLLLYWLLLLLRLKLSPLILSLGFLKSSQGKCFLMLLLQPTYASKVLLLIGKHSAASGHSVVLVTCLALKCCPGAFECLKSRFSISACSPAFSSAAPTPSSASATLHTPDSLDLCHD